MSLIEEIKELRYEEFYYSAQKYADKLKPSFCLLVSKLPEYLKDNVMLGISPDNSIIFEWQFPKPKQMLSIYVSTNSRIGYARIIDIAGVFHNSYGEFCMSDPLPNEIQAILDEFKN